MVPYSWYLPPDTIKSFLQKIKSGQTHRKFLTRLGAQSNVARRRVISQEQGLEEKSNNEVEINDRAGRIKIGKEIRQRNRRRNRRRKNGKRRKEGKKGRRRKRGKKRSKKRNKRGNRRRKGRKRKGRKQKRQKEKEQTTMKMELENTLRKKSE